MGEYENLGQPLDYGDLLRALGKERGYPYPIGIFGNKMQIGKEGKDGEREWLIVDLTRKPEDQDEEVIEQLLELLK